MLCYVNLSGARRRPYIEQHLFDLWVSEWASERWTYGLSLWFLFSFVTSVAGVEKKISLFFCFLKQKVGHAVFFHHWEPLVPLWPKHDASLEGNSNFTCRQMAQRTESCEDAPKFFFFFVLMPVSEHALFLTRTPNPKDVSPNRLVQSPQEAFWFNHSTNFDVQSA